MQITYAHKASSPIYARFYGTKEALEELIEYITLMLSVMKEEL